MSVPPLCFLCCLVFPPFLIALIVSTCSHYLVYLSLRFPLFCASSFLSLCFVYVPRPCSSSWPRHLLFKSGFVLFCWYFVSFCIWLVFIWYFVWSVLFQVVFPLRSDFCFWICYFQFSDSFVSDKVLSSVGVFLFDTLLLKTFLLHLVLCHAIWVQILVWSWHAQGMNIT